MYKTKNDLPEERRKQLIEILNTRLADCIDLQLQAKQAHWNVKGPSFIALHKLFDEVADTAEESVDLIAERIVQLETVATELALTIRKERFDTERMLDEKNEEFRELLLSAQEFEMALSLARQDGCMHMDSAYQKIRGPKESH